MGIDKKYIKELYEALLKLNSVSECEAFMGDLCTPQEIEKMAQRVAAAKCLMKGETYEAVIKKAEISSATLSRVSKSLKYGNGYKKVLKDEN